MRRLTINAFSARQGGGQTYLLNLLRNIPEHCSVILLVGPHNVDVFGQVASDRCQLEVVGNTCSLMNRALWEQRSLPKFLKRMHSDVYYAPGGTMVSQMPDGCVSATAVRNMLPLDDRERKRFPFWALARYKLWVLRRVFLRSYRMVDKLIFISRYSQEVVSRALPIVAGKSTVIPHGLNTAFLRPAQEPYDSSKHGVKPGEFYLYVSTLDYYKAQKEAVMTWKLLSEQGFPYPLLLVGPMNNRYGHEVLTMIDENGLKGKVIWGGKVDYSLLPGLYQAARAMVYASSCECCPNILLEKMAAGKPIFCSSFPPMPEFGGSECYYFDPHCPEQLATSISTAELDQKEFRQKGVALRVQAEQYSWGRTAKTTFSFLCENE